MLALLILAPLTDFSIPSWPYDSWPTVNTPNENGETPLWAAAAFGDRRDVAYVLSRGGAVNLAVRHGQTPLIPAVSRAEAMPVIRKLIESGADVNHRDDLGNPPLIHASIGPCAPPGGNDTHACLELPNPDHVRILLEHGAHVNEQNVDGFTALTYAVQGGHVEIVALLLGYGADVDLLDADGDTPLSFCFTRLPEEEHDLCELLRHASFAGYHMDDEDDPLLTLVFRMGTVLVACSVFGLVQMLRSVSAESGTQRAAARATAKREKEREEARRTEARRQAAEEARVAAAEESRRAKEAEAAARAAAKMEKERKKEKKRAHDKRLKESEKVAAREAARAREEAELDELQREMLELKRQREELKRQNVAPQARARVVEGGDTAVRSKHKPPHSSPRSVDKGPDLMELLGEVEDEM